MFEKIKQ